MSRRSDWVQSATFWLIWKLNWIVSGNQGETQGGESKRLENFPWRLFNFWDDSQWAGWRVAGLSVRCTCHGNMNFRPKALLYGRAAKPNDLIESPRYIYRLYRFSVLTWLCAEIHVLWKYAVILLRTTGYRRPSKWISLSGCWHMHCKSATKCVALAGAFYHAMAFYGR